MKNLLLSLLSVFLLLSCAAAKADDLTITLSSPFQVGEPGNVFAFDATVINNTSETLYLNGDSANVGGSLSVDDSPFQNDWPLSLAAGASYSGLLFNVDVPLGTAYGLYLGTFEIAGGPGSSDDDLISNDASFDINVTPEPSSFLLLATGLVGGLAMFGGIRRRRAL